MKHDLAMIEQVNQLLEIYGSLLTDSQRRMMEDYYVYNLSLTEISENDHISRAAVNDCLKKSLQKLADWEAKLHILKRRQEERALLEHLRAQDASKEDILAAWERMMDDGI